MSAAAPPRRSGRSGRLRSRWLAALAAVLLPAFGAVAWLQMRQVTLLESAQFDSDNIVWSFFQLESEYLGLVSQLHVAAHLPPGTPVDSDGLMLQHELFVSRLPLVSPARLEGHLPPPPQHAQILAHLQAWAAQADPLIGEKATGAATPAQLKALLEGLDARRGEVHELALQASHAMSEQVALRNEAIRIQSRYGISLTVALCLLTLGFAVVVLRQIRRLESREQALEDLATSLSEARGRAEEASRAKSAFLANMSHEIRTPFHGLMGMLGLLQGSPLSARQMQWTRTASASASHLLSLLDDVLDASKLESGRMDLSHEPVYLPELLRDVDQLMRSQAETKGLRFIADLPETGPQWVSTDPVRLKQILFNLLSNAIKFTEAGSVSLTELACAPKDGVTTVRFLIRDTGIGMDDETLSRLFERFSQADVSTSRRFGGTGLGLEISRSLARLLGGDIEVSSHPGVGSTFVLTLPLPVVAHPAPQARSPGTAAGTEPEPMPALKVLVADDNEVNRFYLDALLRQEGHEVVLCVNGDEARRTAAQEHFDVVVLDVHMPVMDGLEAARAIRRLPAPHGQVPMIALSADALENSREQTRLAGMDAFVPKPAQPGQVNAALRQVLKLAPLPVGRPAGLAAPVAPPAPAPAPPPPATAPMPLAPETEDDSPPTQDADGLDDVQWGKLTAMVSPKVLGAMLNAFEHDSQDALQAMRAALLREDSATISMRAHRIRGSALAIGLQSVADAATLLEHQADRQELLDASSSLAQLADRLGRAHRALARRAGRTAPTSPAGG